MSRRELSWYEKVFLKTARAFAGMNVGYYVDFDEELLRQHGISGLIKWGRAAQASFEVIAKTLGNEEAHLVAAFASFFNGCDYCSWGHLFALNLLHLERTGKLYPIDEVEVLELMRRGDTAVLQELERRLKADYPEHLRLLLRQHELRTLESGPVSEEDRALVRSITLFEWVNECSIVVNAPAPPMDRIARKKDLIARYEALRSPLRAESEKQKAAQQHAPA
ncbi:MAG: hypothetical protein Q8L48_08140 [Archangium sp.]|nr:hypothetical protein [Archangium sp.]